MKWIAKKEIAELAPVFAMVLVGMAVLGAVLVPERQALESYLWASGLAGLLLGLTQSFLDHRAENDAFLRHRSISLRDVRIARMLGGFLTVLASVVAPWVLLLLIPGRHGYDIWGVRFDPDAPGDLAFTHAALALGAAATMWSLARLGGAVRRLSLRYVTALLVPGFGVLALLGGSRSTDVTVMIVVPVLATLAVICPARETAGRGALRLVAPTALLGLVVLVVPLFESVHWLRIPLRHALGDAYPAVLIKPDGEVRMRRATWRDRERPAIVTDYDVTRRDILFHGPQGGEGFDKDLKRRGLPARYESATERRLGDGWLWTDPYPRSVDRTLVALQPIFLGSSDVGVALLRSRDGRLHVSRLGAPEPSSVVGSIGPDGFTPGAVPADAERFSDETFLVGHDHPASIRHGAQMALADPVRRSVVFISRVSVEQPHAPEEPDARKVRKKLDFVVTETPLPDDATGAMTGLRQLRYTTLRPGLPEDHRDILTLAAGGELLLLENGSTDPTWTRIPLPDGETLWSWHGAILPEAPIVATLRPPFRDTSQHVRIRVTPEGAETPVTTEFEMAPKDPFEHAIAAGFGGLSLLRPPLLNAVSFGAPAPRSWKELAARWWLDGVIAGGEGIGWLIASLIVGVLCALRNRRQGARRCDDPAERTAWTVAGLVLGPVGVAWMDVIVRKSAVRRAPDGRDLAVHIATDWPLPERTGREVMV